MKTNKNICDTVTLLLRYEDIKVLEPEKFRPSAKLIFENKGASSISCYNNPSKTDLKEGNYYPSLTLSSVVRHGGYSIMLKVQFSAPKLIKENNLEEVCDEDFDNIITTLQSKMLQMGVEVKKIILIKAQTVGIHYGKNIILPKDMFSNLVIKEIEKSNISKRLDTGKTDYRNDGQAIRLHTNSYELCLYDKYQEYIQGFKSPKRSIEKDIIYQNVDFRNLKSQNILRLEFRLNTTAKIKQMLVKTEVKIDSLSFENLFSSDISQKINSHYWNEISLSRKVLRLGREADVDLFNSFLTKYKTLKALQLFGLVKMLTHISVRELRYNAGKSSATLIKLLKMIEREKPSYEYMDEIFRNIEKQVNKNNIITLDKEKKND